MEYVASPSAKNGRGMASALGISNEVAPRTMRKYGKPNHRIMCTASVVGTEFLTVMNQVVRSSPTPAKKVHHSLRETRKLAKQPAANSKLYGLKIQVCTQ